jgi:hypothetical protein
VVLPAPALGHQKALEDWFVPVADQFHPRSVTLRIGLGDVAAAELEV